MASLHPTGWAGRLYIQQGRVIASSCFLPIDALATYRIDAYDYRLPLLRYTGRGWESERVTYAGELLQEFDEMLGSGCARFEIAGDGDGKHHAY